MAKHNELGEKGEQLAAEHLIQSGYEILERNWRFGKDEIDIIARMGDELVIVEVKTRTTDFFGEPGEFVTRAKQGRLVKTAQAYIDQSELDLEVRFDVFGIILQGNRLDIDHIADAFQPQW